jgi:hypothetical protein
MARRTVLALAAVALVLLLVPPSDLSGPLPAAALLLASSSPTAPTDTALSAALEARVIAAKAELAVAAKDEKTAAALLLQAEQLTQRAQMYAKTAAELAPTASATLTALQATLAARQAVEEARKALQTLHGPAGAVTAQDIRAAIEKARQYLIDRKAYADGGPTFLALATLGEDPAGPTMTAAIDWALNSRRNTRGIDATYTRSIQVMAYSVLLRRPDAAKLPRRDEIRQAMKETVEWLISIQGINGGWTYGQRSLMMPDELTRFDFSNTQMAILGLWQASLAGAEIPPAVWLKALKLYYDSQVSDGSWGYTSHVQEGYGSMTAAGLATLYIIGDMLDLDPGCPCGSAAPLASQELSRRIGLALRWLAVNFTATSNPGMSSSGWVPYWLYCAERVGVASGTRRFGAHDWYKEGAEYFLLGQGQEGAWGSSTDTAFALLFLYKGAAPVLFEKLDCGPDVQWNAHSRDLANLTAYIERAKEQLFRWQIVTLTDSLEELHQAPILYISSLTPPKFTAEEKKKLRAFTDTGGTVLVEAACGAASVRAWFVTLAKEVWPEWNVRPLGPDHLTLQDPYKLKQRPEVMGIHDGLRTLAFLAVDDVSCPWHTKALAGKEYLFQWGINLLTYATDHAPLRAALETEAPPKSARADVVVKGGAKTELRLARLKTGADWTVGRPYKGLDLIAAELQKRAGVALKVDEKGADAAALAKVKADVAYLTGSQEVKLSADQQKALKGYLAQGGLVWVEAAGGSTEFDKSFRALAAAAGWQLKVVQKNEPLMTGKFTGAIGYDLTSGITFRHALKLDRSDRPHAELEGIYQDGKLVGVYSPFDAVFSSTPYQAAGIRGYMSDDAMAVALNILLFATDR